MVIGFLLWNRLPEKIATHFGSEGADGWSTKLFAVVIFPLILLVIHLFCLGVTLNDPKKKSDDDADLLDRSGSVCRV